MTRKSEHRPPPTRSCLLFIFQGNGGPGRRRGILYLPIQTYAVAYTGPAGPASLLVVVDQRSIGIHVIKQHQQQLGIYAFDAVDLMMSTNSGLSEAPPTRKPSMSFSVISDTQLAACTKREGTMRAQHGSLLATQT